MRIGIIIILIFFLAPLHAQRIVFEDFNEELLEQEVLNRINRHRMTQGLKALVPDKILAEAASDQVFYLDYLGELTHDQSITAKATPLKRVQYFEGNHEPVGESVGFINFGELTYSSVAERIYLYWKQSPSDYENMTSYAFSHSGIRFSIDMTRQRIYAVQVLGGKILEDEFDPDQPSRRSNTLSPYQELLCTNVEAYASVASSLPNRLSIQGDSVFLDYRDADLLKNVIPNQNDGLAIDIINRNQISCWGGNQFDYSSIYDGQIQPVIYSDQLFADNKYYGGNKIFTFLGTIPRGLQNEKFQVNVITVNGNSACKNSFPVAIPQGPPPFFKIQPIWAFQELDGKVDSRKLQLTYKKVPRGQQIGREQLKRRFPLYFEDNEELVLLEDLNDIQQFAKEQAKLIDTIEINLYSSIEGSRSNNLAFQDDRAREISDILIDAGISSSKIVVNVEENWDLFYKQIRNTNWAQYRNISKREVKDRLQNNQLQRQMYGLLREQRKGEVVVKYSIQKQQRFAAYRKTKTTEASLQKLKQFEKFVNDRQFDNALAAQHNVIQAFLNFELNRADLLSVSVPMEKGFLPHLSNLLAIEIFFTDKLNTRNEFINRIKRILAIDDDYVPMLFNWTGYAVRHLSELNEALVPVKELEFNILELMESSDYQVAYLNSERAMNRLMTNYHLTAVNYYAGSRDYQLRDRALKESRDYAAVCKLGQRENIDLALFFNREYYTNWSLEILKPYFVSGKFSEDLLFTYTQTRALTDGALKDPKFVNLLKLCQKRNAKRFCTWVNENFQLMRSEKVKGLFCESCS